MKQRIMLNLEKWHRNTILQSRAIHFDVFTIPSIVFSAFSFGEHLKGKRLYNRLYCRVSFYSLICKNKL